MKNIKLKMALLSFSLIGLTTTAISSIISSMILVYREVSPEFIKALVTVPSATLIIFSLLCGRLSLKFPAKKMIHIGLGIYFVGGILPAFLDNIYLIFLMRLLLGVGAGLLMPFSQSLIPQFFDGKERDRVMGMQSTVVSVSTMVCGSLAGILGASDWHRAFWIYLIVIPVFLVTWIGLPDIHSQPIEKGGEKKKLSANVYIIGLLMCIFYLFVFCFFSNISLLIQEKKLGGTSLSGNIVAIYYMAGIAGGILFGLIPEKKYRWVVPVFGTSSSLGSLLLGLGENSVLIFAGAALLGLGFSVIMPYSVKKTSLSVGLGIITLANSVLIVFYNIGAVASPYVLSIIQKPLHIERYSALFLICAVGLMVLWIVAFLLELKDGKELHYGD